MKSRLTLHASIVGCLLVGGSCNEGLDQAPVDVSFTVTNENGQEMSSFTTNDDIVLNFVVTNNSDENITWYDGLPKHFFVINKMDDSEKNAHAMGSPYSYFISPSVLGISIPAKKSFYIKLAWNDSNHSMLSGWDYEPSHNPPLPPGKYMSFLDFTLKFYGYEDLAFKKTLNFEII